MSMPASLSRPKRAAAAATATAINASLKEQDKKIVEEPQDATPTSSKRKRNNGTKDQATLKLPTPGFEISAELDEAAMLDMTRQLKESMLPPDQSNFRVAALCTFRHEGRLRAIAGANSEPCELCGAICAERSALVQLRLMPSPPLVECVYIVADSEEPITPGMLCREYMSDTYCTPETKVVTAGAADRPNVRATLGELFPCPAPLQRVARDDLAATAERLGTAGADGVDRFFAREGDAGRRLARLFARLVLQATAETHAAVLHPLRLAAGLLLPDGTEAIATQHQAREHRGCG